MSREIKFRAWLIKEKTMVKVDEFDFGNYKIGFYYSGIEEIRQRMNYVKLYNVMLMPYTWLTDKNGKRIYEGDILLVANGSINGSIMFSKRVVKWCEDKRGWNVPNFDGAYEPTHYYEVIGNVYENPDLKEDQNE